MLDPSLPPLQALLRTLKNTNKDRFDKINSLVNLNLLVNVEQKELKNIADVTSKFKTFFLTCPR